MARITLNLNVAASAFAAGFSKVRVKTVGDELFIKPTDRVSAKNLPKGEKLIDLRTKGNTVRFALVDELAETLAVGDRRGVVAAKHGWLAVSQGAPETKESAALRVSEK